MVKLLLIGGACGGRSFEYSGPLRHGHQFGVVPVPAVCDVVMHTYELRCWNLDGVSCLRWTASPPGMSAAAVFDRLEQAYAKEPTA